MDRRAEVKELEDMRNIEKQCFLVNNDQEALRRCKAIEVAIKALSVFKEDRDTSNLEEE